MNPLHAFLRSRRSVRYFRADPVPARAVRRILATACYAPSAHNEQPWRFVVVGKPKARSRLVDKITTKFRQDMISTGVAEQEIQDRIDRTKRRVAEAPVVIVLCQDVTLLESQPDEVHRSAELKMGAQSTALAGLQLLLAAHAEGLGGTWICWPLFAPEETRQALELPLEWEPQGMFFLGYAAEDPRLHERKPLKNILLNR